MKNILKAWLLMLVCSLLFVPMLGSKGGKKSYVMSAIPVAYDTGRPPGQQWVFLLIQPLTTPNVYPPFRAFNNAQEVPKEIAIDWNDKSKQFCGEKGDAGYCFVKVVFTRAGKLYQKNVRDCAWASMSDIANKTIKHGKKERPSVSKIDPVTLATLIDGGEPAIKRFGGIPESSSGTGGITKPPVLVGNTWPKPGTPGTVHFYVKGHGCYEFANTCDGFPIKLGVIKRDEKPWKPAGNPVKWLSTEHYFQAHKDVDPWGFYKNQLQKIAPGAAVQRAGKQAKGYKKEIWETQGMRYGVMLEAVRAKVNQNQRVYDLLEKSGDDLIVEDTAKLDPKITFRDNEWGAGDNYDGQNQLGRILMWVRKELKTGMQREYPWQLSAQEFMTELNKNWAGEEPVVEKPVDPLQGALERLSDSLVALEKELVEARKRA
jgi:hypothetical protein